MIPNPVPGNKNPEAVGAGFGRIFYAIDSRIYFSQVLTTPSLAGKCHQNNDPTSDESPDLLDTDGGVINLSGAVGIKAIKEYRLGMLFFAENGLWYVFGPDGGFKATGFNISKVSERGIDSPKSIVNAEGQLFYFSDNGIVQVIANEFDNLSGQDITETTIRKRYLEKFVGKGTMGSYKSDEKEIWWINDTDSEILVLDMASGGFYPQRNSGVDLLSVSISTLDKFLYTSYTDTNDALLYSFSETSDIAFQDYGVDQEAFLLSGPETLGVFSNNKNIATINVHFNKTEENVIGTNPDGSYIFDLPSACLMQAFFDFDDTNAFKNHSRKKSIYRPNLRGFLVDSIPSPFDTGQTVVTFKDTMRGSGKAVAFRFEAEPLKDMQLLGYSVDYSMRGRQ